MADKMTTGYVAKSGLIVTPKGRMLYPGLFKATLMKGETDQSRASFQLTLLFPKGADLTLLAKAVSDCAVEKWGANPKFKIKKPFIKVEDQPRFAEHAADYPVMVRAGNKQKPSLVYANGAPCDKEEEVYGGRWAAMSLNVFAWEHPTGGKGVSLSLNHVMLLDNDEPMGGGRVRVEDTFEAVETDGAGGATSSADLF